MSRSFITFHQYLKTVNLKSSKLISQLESQLEFLIDHQSIHILQAFYPDSCCKMIDICTRCFKLSFSFLYFLFNDNNKYLNFLCTISYLIATSIRTTKVFFCLRCQMKNILNSCFYYTTIG